MADVRVSPPRIFAQATHASRPPADAAGSADAHRQTGFVLGEETEHVLAGLTLESAVAAEAAGSRYRNLTVAAALATGSRGWLARLQALHAIEWGNYASAIPLIASAAEHETASASVLGNAASSWQEWLAEDGLADLADERATEFALGREFVSDPSLPPLLLEVRAAATTLAQPRAGAALLLTGGESGAGRLAITFGDRDFHVGLAEIGLGWLLALGVAKTEVLLAAGTTLPLPGEEAMRRWSERAKPMIAAPRRCRVERIELAGVERYVVENWRRAPAGAVRRIVL